MASNALETLTEPTIKILEKQVKDEKAEIELYKMDMSIYFEEWKDAKAVQNNWVENRNRMYHLVLTQSPPKLTTQLKSLSTWDSINATTDVVELLKLIHDVTPQAC